MNSINQVTKTTQLFDKLNIVLTSQIQLLSGWAGVAELNALGRPELHMTYLIPLQILTFCSVYPEEVAHLNVEVVEGHLHSQPLLESNKRLAERWFLSYNPDKETVKVVPPQIQELEQFRRVENGQAAMFLRMLYSWCIKEFKPYIWGESNYAELLSELDFDLELWPDDVDWFLLLTEIMACLAWSYATQLKILGVNGLVWLDARHVISVANISSRFLDQLVDLRTVRSDKDPEELPMELTGLVTRLFRSVKELARSYNYPANLPGPPSSEYQNQLAEYHPQMKACVVPKLQKKDEHPEPAVKEQKRSLWGKWFAVKNRT